MNPFLQMLIGQQSSGSLPGIIPGYGGGTFNPDGTQVTPIEDEILVQGNRNNREVSAPVDGMSAPNDGAITNVQADIKRGQEASDRKGMFGTKGTLRDILGLVGDAFLVQGGRDPYYAPRRRQEQISDAWAGASEDPQAAAERVGYYDPKLGQEILSDYESNLVKEAQAKSLAESRTSLSEDRKFKKYLRAREAIGGLFNTPGAVVNGQISPAALRQAEKIAASADMTLEEFMISEGMTEEDVRNYAAGIPNVYQQERLEDADANIGIANRNAASRETSASASMIRAQRPPAGRAATNPTDASELARIRGKLNRNEPLSAGDKVTWEKYTRPPTTRRSGRGRSGDEPRFGPPRQ